MKLIETILNELTDIKISLTSPLLKTKIFAHQIQNENLVFWINCEVNGYKKSDILPDYRKTTSEICADYQHGNWKFDKTVLSIPKQNEDIAINLYSLDFYQSIEFLESFNKTSNQFLLEILDKEQKRALTFYLESQNYNLYITDIYRRIPSNFINEILSSVRNRLLDFIIQLDDSFDLSNIKQLTAQNKEIKTIMRTTIYNTGDGNILNTGNNTNITGTISIVKGNKDALRDHLIKFNVADENINDLLEIVDLEKPEIGGNFSREVNLWIGKMINKAIDGTWQIGIGAAGGILATALQQYYGIK